MKARLLLNLVVIAILLLVIMYFVGCEKNDNENGDKPIAEFTVDHTTVNYGYTINFTDESSNIPTSWSWDFGDGDSSTLQNPSYKYNSTDIFTVTLTATNEYGSNTETKTDYITVVFGFPTGTVTDIEGKVYQTVQIGSQEWMSENLATTKYNDGSEIPFVPDDDEWSSLSSPGYCWYLHEIDCYGIKQERYMNAGETYGALYNGYAANSDKLCPTGWHVPSDDEWKKLEIYLGMDKNDADSTQWRGTNEGGKLKELGYAKWHEPNTGATNETGFSAFPGGDRMPSNGRY
ncbi:MAG: PKD domain-containing protein, partial [Bacteroidales bacterium]|nr:PKD domain-containing protein [Bacteroidales bacterium]